MDVIFPPVACNRIGRDAHASVHNCMHHFGGGYGSSLFISHTMVKNSTHAAPLNTAMANAHGQPPAKITTAPMAPMASALVVRFNRLPPDFFFGGSLISPPSDAASTTAAERARTFLAPNPSTPRIETAAETSPSSGVLRASATPPIGPLSTFALVRRPLPATTTRARSHPTSARPHSTPLDNLPHRSHPAPRIAARVAPRRQPSILVTVFPTRPLAHSGAHADVATTLMSPRTT